MNIIRTSNERYAPAPKVRIGNWLLALTLLVALCGSAWAQKKDDLSINLTAKKIILAADGKETLQPADTAKPGEVIEYTGVFKNTTPAAIRDLKPVIPIPTGMAYVAGTAKPKAVEGSLDGRNFAPYPIKRKVTLPDGKTEEQEVPLSAYRSLRWNTGDLKAGETITVSLRARLNPVTSPLTQ